MQFTVRDLRAQVAGDVLILNRDKNLHSLEIYMMLFFKSK